MAFYGYGGFQIYKGMKIHLTKIRQSEYTAAQDLPQALYKPYKQQSYRLLGMSRTLHRAKIMDAPKKIVLVMLKHLAVRFGVWAPKTLSVFACAAVKLRQKTLAVFACLAAKLNTRLKKTLSVLASQHNDCRQKGFSYLLKKQTTPLL